MTRVIRAASSDQSCPARLPPARSPGGRAATPTRLGGKLSQAQDDIGRRPLQSATSADAAPQAGRPPRASAAALARLRGIHAPSPCGEHSRWRRRVKALAPVATEHGPPGVTSSALYPRPGGCQPRAMADIAPLSAASKLTAAPLSRRPARALLIGERINTAGLERTTSSPPRPCRSARATTASWRCSATGWWC